MRGRGRGRGRPQDDGGTERLGPVTEEPPAYPRNPNLTEGADLEADQRKLVIFSRLFTNYWKNSEFHFPTQSGAGGGVTTFTMSSAHDVTDPQTQKELILSHTAPEYFPEELLQNFFVPRRRLAMQKKRKTANDAEKKDGDEEEKESEEEQEVVEDDDYGGEDYAHDHYADEDREEMDDDGGDEGVF